MQQKKQLVQFLNEKQEPFALDVYLLERGYQMQKRFNSQHNYLSLCYSKNSKKFIKKIKFIPNCSKIVQNLFNGISQVNRDQKTKNSGNGDQFEAAEDDKFSSASSHTVFISCSDSDLEERHYASVQDYGTSSTADNYRKKDGMNFARRCVEDNNQLSPVSVLQDTESHDVSTIHKKEKRAKRSSQPGSSISISLCKYEKPFDTNISMENQQLIDSKLFAHYTKNKRAVLQTKQLLFDCVREVVENETRNKNSGQQFQKILGAEELWKLIYENIWLWSKEPIDEANINQLSHFDLLISGDEWNYLEKQRNEIGIEIGDAIFEDISNEIIVEMMNFV